MGRYEEALSDLTRAIELNPSYAWAVAHRGAIYRYQGQNEQAEADFRKAINLNSNYAWAWAYLSVVCALQNKYEEAWNSLIQALRLDPELPVQSSEWAKALRVGMGGDITFSLEEETQSE
jgi:tetratricopeptide (TPR) repeat protein